MSVCLFKLRFQQFPGDISRNFLSFRECPSLCDESLDLLRGSQVEPFRQFFYRPAIRLNFYRSFHDDFYALLFTTYCPNAQKTNRKDGLRLKANF